MENNFEAILDESTDEDFDMEEEDDDEYDREVNNILADVEEVMELNNEEVNEIRILVDSDYNSDCSVDSNDQSNNKQVRYLKQANINDIDELQKMCLIAFYYEADSDKFCTACFLQVSDMYSHARAVREHETDRYVYLVGDKCCNCKSYLGQIFSCNLCPICVMTQ